MLEGLIHQLTSNLSNGKIANDGQFGLTMHLLADSSRKCSSCKDLTTWPCSVTRHRAMFFWSVVVLVSFAKFLPLLPCPRWWLPNLALLVFEFLHWDGWTIPCGSQTSGIVTLPNMHGQHYLGITHCNVHACACMQHHADDRQINHLHIMHCVRAQHACTLHLLPSLGTTTKPHLHGWNTSALTNISHQHPNNSNTNSSASMMSTTLSALLKLHAPSEATCCPGTMQGAPTMHPDNLTNHDPTLSNTHSSLLMTLTSCKCTRRQTHHFWVAEEIDLSWDCHNWENKLLDPEHHFVSHALAFFACADAITAENLAKNFAADVQSLAACFFCGFQIMVENVHFETCSLLIDTLIADPDGHPPVAITTACFLLTIWKHCVGIRRKNCDEEEQTRFYVGSTQWPTGPGHCTEKNPAACGLPMINLCFLLLRHTHLWCSCKV